MQAARAAYLARKPLTDKQLRSGVLRDINDLALWEVYGGRSECLAAPRNDVYRKRLVLWGRTLAQQDEAKEMEDEAKKGRGEAPSAYGPSSSRTSSATSYTSRGARPTRRRPVGGGSPYEPLDDDEDD